MEMSSRHVSLARQPARLDAQAIRGAVKLLTMFATHTEIDQEEALRMLDCVPSNSRTPAWRRIRAEIDGGAETLLQDLSELEDRDDLTKTARQMLINARLGQGKFRRTVELLWGESCSVSGCSVREVLRASHIKPWKQSTDHERLDCHNGLLLTADLDALCDRGLISFADDGEMLVSSRLATSDRKLFRLDRPLRKQPNRTLCRYLADHRRRWAFDPV